MTPASEENRKFETVKHYCLFTLRGPQNLEALGASQIQVYNINNESVAHLSQFVSVKAKKSSGKSQAQFREKLRKLRLKQNDGFVLEDMYVYRVNQGRPRLLERKLVW